MPSTARTGGAGRATRGRREAAEARRARRAALTESDEVTDAAAAFLSVRPRSIAETRGRLRQLGYPATLVEAVVERLIDIGFLDDAAFARWWVESRDRARPRGVLALRQELLRKGVARETVDEVLVEREDRSAGPTGAAGQIDVSADTGAARRLLVKREAALRREVDPRRRRQKAYALLARHGFTPDVCREVSAGVVVAGEVPDERAEAAV